MADMRPPHALSAGRDARLGATRGFHHGLLLEVVVSLLRGLRLRCPCCGYGPLFDTAFRMHDRCSACGEKFEREPGQWLGAVYVNLGLTLGPVAVGILFTQTFTTLPTTWQIAIWTPLAGLGPLVFYRASKGLWTSIIFIGEGLYIPWPSR